MTVRPTAILTESDVVQVLERLKNKIPHRLIAQEFGVSKKTISRINTGETWREVSLRYGARPPAQVGPFNLVGLSNEFCDLHDEIIRNVLPGRLTHIFHKRLSAYEKRRLILS